MPGSPTPPTTRSPTRPSPPPSPGLPWASGRRGNQRYLSRLVAGGCPSDSACARWMTGKGRTMGHTAGRFGSHGIRRGRRAARLAGAAALAAAALLAVAPSAQAADGDFTGALSTFTVTESAINLGNTQVPGITVGIRRLGFAVVSSTPPRTGFCRIAGSATCSFLLLAGHETQTYTLTLSPQAPGTYTIQGWTRQPSTG